MSIDRSNVFYSFSLLHKKWQWALTSGMDRTVIIYVCVCIVMINYVWDERCCLVGVIKNEEEKKYVNVPSV